MGGEVVPLFELPAKGRDLGRRLLGGATRFATGGARTAGAAGLLLDLLSRGGTAAAFALLLLVVAPESDYRHETQHHYTQNKLFHANKFKGKQKDELQIYAV